MKQKQQQKRREKFNMVKFVCASDTINERANIPETNRCCL